jgi:hypothetical protein
MRQIADFLRPRPWIQILISAITFLLGLFAQPILQTQIEPLLSPQNIPLTMFVLVATLFAAIIAIYSHTQYRIHQISQDTHLLAKYVGHRIRILTHAEGYEEVRKRTQEARFEVLKLIYYELQNGKPVYDNLTLQSLERKATYEDELQKLQKIQQEKGQSNFKYVEIVQIPKAFALEDILKNDPIYKASCEFFSSVSHQEPEFISLKTSEIIFPNTVIIIDSSFLYIAFQTKNPDTGTYEYPFLGIVIEDPSSEAVKDMLKLFKRIDANSRLVTSLKIGNPVP